MKKLLFLLVLLVVFACHTQAAPESTLLPEAPPPSRAKWSCYPEPPPESIRKPRYYRDVITVKEGLKSARLIFRVDDMGYGMVDGTPLPIDCRLKVQPQPGRPQLVTEQYQLVTLLPPGRHCLAFQITNAAGLGGLLCRLELMYADGTEENIYSDSHWLSSPSAPKGWNLVDFNAEGWKPCQELGDIHIPPWSPLIDLLPLRSSSEVKLEEAIYAQRKVRQQQLLAAFAKETKPRVTLSYERGQAIINIGNKKVKPIIYKNAGTSAFDSPTYRQQVRDFAQGGTHLHSLAVSADAFWRADGVIDYEHIQNWLLNYLELDPDGYLMVSLAFQRPPKWWLAAHPDECVDYANGGRDMKAVDALRRFVAPSFASRQWLQDVDKVIRDIVTHLEQSPLGARIFAYRLDYGVYTEWHYFGMADGMPDSSRPMTDYFRQWLRKHYNSDSELQAAWHLPDVTLDTAVTPPKDVRLANGAGQLRDAVANRWTIDYLTAHGEACRDCLLTFNRAAKEACGFRALTGNFSGYFFGMHFPAEGWHLANDEILDSPFVDFQSSPYVYGEMFRNLGKSGQARALIDSFRLRGKLCLLEADSRTHLQPQDGHVFARNDSESIGLLARDMAVALQHGCGLWYFDFGRSWYSTPALRGYLHGLRTFHDLQADVSSAAEIAVIGDYASVPFHATETTSYTHSYVGIDETIRELGACGVPYDMLSFKDLERPDVKDYKLYFFINLCHVTPEKLAVVDRLKRNGHTLLWHNSAGYLSNEGHGSQSVEQLTGIHTHELPHSVMPTLKLTDGRSYSALRAFPVTAVCAIDDPQATTLATLVHDFQNLPACGSKSLQGWDSILCTLPYIPRALFIDIFRKHNIFRYTDTPDASVFANASMVMLHADRNASYKLKFPRKGQWKQIFPKQIVAAQQADSLTFRAQAGMTYIFQVD